jgi:hypothetical protein
MVRIDMRSLEVVSLDSISLNPEEQLLAVSSNTGTSLDAVRECFQYLSDRYFYKESLGTNRMKSRGFNRELSFRKTLNLQNIHGNLDFVSPVYTRYVSMYNSINRSGVSIDTDQLFIGDDLPDHVFTAQAELSLPRPKITKIGRFTIAMLHGSNFEDDHEDPDLTNLSTIVQLDRTDPNVQIFKLADEEL